MERLSQSGIIMADFGKLLTNLSSVVEEEMTEALNTAQQEADFQLKQAAYQSAEDNANHAATLKHATDQLGLVSAVNAELKAELEKARALNDQLQVYAKLDHAGIARTISVISANLDGTTAVQRKAIDALGDLEELLQVFIPEAVPVHPRSLNAIADDVASRKSAGQPVVAS